MPDLTWGEIERNIKFRPGPDGQEFSGAEKQRILDELERVWDTQTGKDVLERYATTKLVVKHTTDINHSKGSARPDTIFINIGQAAAMLTITRSGEIIKPDLYRVLVHEILHGHPDYGFLEDPQISTFVLPTTDYLGEASRVTNQIIQEIEGVGRERISYFTEWQEANVPGLDGSYIIPDLIDLGSGCIDSSAQA